MELNLKLTDGARRDIRRDAEHNCEGATVADTLRLLDDFETLAKAYRELGASYNDNLKLSGARALKIAEQAAQLGALEAASPSTKALLTDEGLAKLAECAADAKVRRP